MPRRAIDNAVVEPLLATLLERDAHPYDLAERLGAAGHRASRATVYDVVRALVSVGWVRARGVEREGARPERTVYELTDDGRAELARRLDRQVRDTEPERSRFCTAVSHLGVLGRSGARSALEERALRLRSQIAEDEQTLRRALEATRVPRLFVIEAEYALHQRRAELVWVEQVLADIASGALAWPTRRRGR